MGKICQYFVVAPQKMEKNAKKELALRVYHEAHCEIFDGTTFEDFFHTVFEPPTCCTKIIIYRNAQRILGYATFHVYKVEQQHDPVYVVMSEMGITELAHANSYHPTYFLFKESVSFSAKHPLARMFLVDTLISPIIYKRVCKMFGEVYPKQDTAIPPDLAPVMQSVADHFHWHTYQEHEAMVRHLNWKVRPNYLPTTNPNDHDPYMDYFSSRVTHCEQGEGLVVIVPVSVKNIVSSVWKSARFYLLHRHKLQRSKE